MNKRTRFDDFLDEWGAFLVLVSFIVIFAFLIVYTTAISPRVVCRQYSQMYPDREIRYYSQFGCVEKRGGDWVILEFDLGHSNGQGGGQ